MLILCEPVSLSHRDRCDFIQIYYSTYKEKHMFITFDSINSVLFCIACNSKLFILKFSVNVQKLIKNKGFIYRVSIKSNESERNLNWLFVHW